MATPGFMTASGFGAAIDYVCNKLIASINYISMLSWLQTEATCSRW